MGVDKKLRKKVRKVNKKILRNIIIAFFVYPLVYAKRHKINRIGPIQENFDKKHPWWYWYGNASELLPTNPQMCDLDACWYGDDNWRKRKGIKRKNYFVSLRWNVFRNGVWNLRYKLGADWRGPINPESLKVYVNEDENGNCYPRMSSIIWCNKSIPGRREVEFRYLETGARGYRISSTMPKGKGWLNKMEGTGSGAPIFKRRRFRKLEQ